MEAGLREVSACALYKLFMPMKAGTITASFTGLDRWGHVGCGEDGTGSVAAHGRCTDGAYPYPLYKLGVRPKVFSHVCRSFHYRPDSPLPPS
ncbi:hypothetical protein PIB30_090056, partial [Stylosanthes scabra]|nr:hypothetical protein [Stylosanthes scabra]